MRNKLSALRFQDKIFFAYGFVFLVMFGVVFGSTSYLIRHHFEKEIESYVETIKAQISNNYQGFLNKVQKQVRDVRGQDTSSSVYRLQTWLETTQTSLQSDEHPIFLAKSEMPSDEWLPLNNAARKAEDRTWFRPQGTKETEGRAFTNFWITPFNSPFVTPRDTPTVGLIVAYSHEREMEWQQQLTITLLLSGLGGLVLVYLISYIISRRITRPIAVLHEGVSHIAAGNLEHRVNIRSRNEVGQLAEGFNQMARDLKQSLEKHMAAERAATWRDAARQVAHEVKNPLFPIRLSVENLQQAKANPEVFEQIFRECTDTIIEEVDRIVKLIDEFHEFARMPKPQWEWTQLNDIVTSVLTLYTGRHTSDLAQDTDSAPPGAAQADSVTKDSTEKVWLENISKIKVSTELAPLPQLLVDPEQMTQALGNLLKNAIEAMPDGGSLKVKTYFTPNAGTDEKQAEADPNDMDTPGTVSLEIHDTGHGMSEETLANLFVPYYTTKSEANGRGLGVPIVRRIVTEHGADIDFQSTEGEGTTVRIDFLDDPRIRAEGFASAVEELMPHTGVVPQLETEDPTRGVNP